MPVGSRSLTASPANEPRDGSVPGKARTSFFEEARTALGHQGVLRLVLAGPRGDRPDLQRVVARPLQVRGEACLSLTYHHRHRDLVRNLPTDEGLAVLAELISTDFNNLHLITPRGELQLAVSRKGRETLRLNPRIAATGEAATSVAVAPALHDRAKRRPVDIASPFLAALGVTDAEHRLIPAMARKWKQINRFVELLAPALAAAGLAESKAHSTPVRVLDFGSGKGYLTFAVHEHLCKTGLVPDVIGIDLKDDMVALGNDTVAALGLTGLAFEHGDVSAASGRACDVLIALHACDTATDHAMHAGIRARAKVIMCSPCCHKQLRPQMRSPTLLLPLLRHGIHLGQEAEMLTDGLRALLLEAEGYDTQVFEFTSLEHTSKNKMILAVRRADADDSAHMAQRAAGLRAQVGELKQFYGVAQQELETLLQTSSTDSR